MPEKVAPSPRKPSALPNAKPLTNYEDKPMQRKWISLSADPCQPPRCTVKLRGIARSTTFALCLLLCTLGLGHSAAAHEPGIISFEAPGAGTSPGQGTEAISINAEGVITGAYVDASNTVHGFLRYPDGRFTTV